MKKYSHHKTRRAAFNVLFYGLIAAVLFAGLTYGMASDTPRYFGGYSVMTVLTGSMQREIPQGSLVVIKKTDPATIGIGDDITYMLDDQKTITHRVIGIYENYCGSSQRGFVTKGLENALADKDVVYAKNTVGKVVFCLPGFTSTVEYIKTRWHIILIPGLSLLIALILLKKSFGRESPDEEIQTAASRKGGDYG